MLETLRWLLTIEVISLATVPVVLRALPNLSDRGWGLARPIALILVGTLAWLLSYAHAIPNSMIGWWLVTALVAVPSLAVGFRDRSRIGFFIRTRWKLIVASELLFLLFFAMVVVLRGFVPSIEATEKPMEFMLLNSAVHTPHAPPQDSWLAGHAVSYYYFGYWMLGGLSTMSGVATDYAFNLSLALIASSAAAASFSVASSLIRRDGGSYRAAIVVGVGSSFLLLFVASLAGWWELGAHLGIIPSGILNWVHIKGLDGTETVNNWRPEQFWWWFRASRVINSFDPSGAGLDMTIEEFPSFSFILGDLHPHVISIPFVLAGIGVAANLFFSAERWGLSWIRRNRWQSFVVVLVIGAAGFVNAWDLLFLFTLLAGVTALKVTREREMSLPQAILYALPPLAIFAVAMLVIYSPYYLGTLESQVKSPFLAPVKHGTRIVHFLTVWGVFLLLSAAFVTTALKKSLSPQLEQTNMVEFRPGPGTRVSPGTWWLGGITVAVLYVAWFLTHMGYNDGATLSDVVTRLAVAGPLAVLFVCLLATLDWRGRRGASDSTQFALALLTLVVFMLYAVELFFALDRFGNRMNTVFKLYYEAWIALAVIATYCGYMWWRLHPRLKGRALLASRTGAILMAVLAIGPIYYTFAAAVTRADEYQGSFTLDGLAWLKDRSPDEYAAIEWLRDNVNEQAVIAEGVGNSYTEFARISETTGLPTVIGWTGHEDQWHHDPSIFAGREQDVRDLYETSDISKAEEIIAKYNITYVVLGSRERSTYTGLDASKFDTLGDRAFEQGAMVIYRLR